MTNLRQAAEMALEALREINKLSVGEKAVCLPAEIDGAMEALRQALAQPHLANVGEVGVGGWIRRGKNETKEVWETDYIFLMHILMVRKRLRHLRTRYMAYETTHKNERQ